MASSDAFPVPRKNVAYRVTFPILDADGDPVTGATGLDSEISKDGAQFADCTNEATEITAATGGGVSGVYYLDLTSTEMNADTVAIVVRTTSSGAKTTVLVIYPEEIGDYRVNVSQFGGTTVTGRDIGASVLLSTGTGTGQLDFTSGVVKSNLAQILGTALTETAGQIAAAFKKFFDKATPTGTINSIPDAVAGATGGLFIAGTNAATTVTTGLTTTFTGNLTGSVGSVTGAVGSVTGAVGSVTGNVGGNVTGSVGSVTGAVGSVTGNVGGNVTGSVGSVVGLTASNLDTTVSSRLAPTVAARTLDVSATGEAGIDWANVGTPGSTVALSGTTVGTVTTTGTATAVTTVNGLSAGTIDSILDDPIEGSMTLRQALRVILAAVSGKLSGAATTTVTIRDLADTKARITATVDADGNRSAVTLDAT